MDKILVVDDEIINIMFAKKILGEKYDIMTASSGEGALEILTNEVPDLILLDIHMEGIDGYETLKKIKGDVRLKNIPVIFLTADDDSSSEDKGFELGADDFIRKPLISAVVLRRVERCIDIYKLHTNLQNEVQKQTREVEAAKAKIEEMSMEIIETLTTAIEAKDDYTRGHSSRVAEYSTILARKLGYDEKKVSELNYKAMLHDVGKIGVPDGVLNKAGRLTDDEYEVIKSHTTLGSDILKRVSSMPDLYCIARHHHERYDGKGYPDGLAGEDIPEEARIVAIADAYDAMSSDRIYRKALSAEVIESELIRGRGLQFDPDMLDAFLELLHDGIITP